MEQAIAAVAIAFDTHAVFVDEWSRTVVVPPWLERNAPEYTAQVRDAEGAWSAYSSDEYSSGIPLASLSEEEFRALVRVRAIITLSRVLVKAASAFEFDIVTRAIETRPELKTRSDQTMQLTFAARGGTLNGGECECPDCQARRLRRPKTN